MALDKEQQRTPGKSVEQSGNALWLAVDEPASRTSHRGVIERGAIGLLSRRVNVHADPPSPTWLGLHAPAHQIRTSGLWNVNHVDEPYDAAFLDVMEAHIADLDRAGH